MTPVFVGGLIRWFIERKRESDQQLNIAEQQTDTGVLLGSGLIAGEGIMGVLIAAYAIWATKAPAITTAMAVASRSKWASRTFRAGFLPGLLAE